MIRTFSRAVAVFGFRRAGGGTPLVGTGALIRRASPGGEAYFLTARHAFQFHGTTVRLGAYDNFEAYWDYAGNSGPGFLPRAEILECLPRSHGAVLLATGEANDFALLRLNESPPGDRVYLGWSAEPCAERELHRLSHPYFSPQVHTRHRRLLASESTDEFEGVASRLCGCRPQGPFHHSSFQGKLGPGSSGSPLVTPDLRLVGQLWGLCERGGQTFAIDGNFTHTYPQVRKWLDPSGQREAALLDLG